MRKILLLNLLFFLFILPVVKSQIILPQNGVAYTEDFNSLGTLGTTNLPTNWKMTAAGVSTVSYTDVNNLTQVNIAASSGSPTTGGRYNWGSSASERSIGFMTSGGYANPNSIMTAFVNKAATALNKVTISFNIKRYRTNVSNASVQFYYSLDGTTWVAVSSGEVLTTELPTGANTYSFASPLTVSKSFSITSLDIQPEDKIYFRWNFNTTGSNSQGIGLDDFIITPTYRNPTDPLISATSSSLAFGNQGINISSNEKSFTLNYTYLDGTNIALNTNAPFYISKTSGGNFLTNLSYTQAELNGTNTTVYVKYLPTVIGSSADNITISGGGISNNLTIALSGFGVLPNNTSFNFENCTPANSTTLSEGFIQYSVTGPQTWACTTSYGHDLNDPTGKASTGNAVQINGGTTSSSTENEDWLISPSMDLSSMNYPLLSFWSRTDFNGPVLQLKVSTNYTGSGDPKLATWVDLDGRFPEILSNTWTKSQNIDLSNFKTTGVYIAFVYTSTTSNPPNGARWTIDDIDITNSSTPAPLEVNLLASSINFGYQAPGASSPEKTFKFSATSTTDNVVLTAPANFSISKTSGGSFSQNISYTSAEVNGKTTTVYTQFTPNTANINYNQNLTLSTTGITDKNLNLTGNSFNTTNTLEVVNWNIEWFGSTVSGQGPTDVTKQAQNVRTVFNNINADIYGLAEVVDTLLFRNTVLPPGYNVIFSDFGSYADDKTSSGYDGTQKLAFVYRTDIIKPKNWYGVLRDTYYPNNLSNNAAGSPFKNWSSGRFPFLMEAKVLINGAEETIYFIQIHAKANTGDLIDSYDRRKGGAIQLKQYIDANLADKKVIILGDFNDVLNPDKTIAPMPANTPTSYIDITSDNTNYVPITLPLSLAGKRSTVSFNTVIDNVIINKNLNNNYLINTAEVLDNVATLVTSYGTTTTDHYPIQTRYFFEPTPLNVNFVSFIATTNKNVVNLKWSTATETNNSYFTIERSVDGKKFTSIKTITGAGNSNEPKSYATIDNNAPKGTIYYRLKQTDFNNDYTYYPEVKSVNIFGTEAFSVYPNPVKNQLFLNYESTSTNDKLVMSGVDGKVILTATGTNEQITSKVNSKLNTLTTGVYILKLTTGNKTYQSKLIKQ
ncbi:T9SS type A sorting domain-containing protein [Pedobacter sp.]|uniref:T9SS type A sorting domain-containing protein n=1 Tax=Pedobacter sp. TaxID=1411316 RepID=UPI00396C4120